MQDTVASSLWLSLVDMLVVFAVLTLLMLICYGLRFFSRGMLVEGSGIQEENGTVDAAAGDEPASEFPMLQHPSRPSNVREQPTQLVSVSESTPEVSGDIAGEVQGPARAAGSRTFRIAVDGNLFDVEVRQSEVGQPLIQSFGQTTAAAPGIAPAAAQPRIAAPLSPTDVSPSGPSMHSAGASNIMKSPLPGKILKVFAAPGKAFKKGDTLMIIEAMKMENEILAPRDCVITEVSVEVNQSVKTGEPLLRME